MGQLLVFSDSVDRCLERIARVAGWLFVALVVVICFDVLTRKVGFQLPGFGSTPIQEMEWHLHGALFLSWLGYAYVRNVHVRIDVFTAGLSARRQAWLEVIGIILFAIPYCMVATWFAFWYAELSFMQNESSDAPNGLPYRWIIKACLFLGLLLLCFAVASVLSRRLVFLFGPPALAAKAAPPGASH
ncbi:MAG: TRAP transporter small permease subunit [Alphaproteobacteria bacterium]|nr:TRAP transporter small permease subunit [Alphaproteobacteria bacterium]